ncbi:4345_t:CDS:2 [Funneliformis caledonium]|uniref:4345_t:CDS:1 n=1 Tax=Funneliformis caledonium TaxID=1117310 RepID=A0A9N8ZN84_9GLOM|nr:4345_t:CDS:2 [Funneliformis caledonium]
MSGVDDEELPYSDDELKREHSEGWFDVDVWSVIVDFDFIAFEDYRPSEKGFAVATRKK